MQKTGALLLIATVAALQGCANFMTTVDGVTNTAEPGSCQVDPFLELTNELQSCQQAQADSPTYGKAVIQ